MFIRQSTLDDLLLAVFKKILNSKSSVNATRGPNFELFGVILELSNPRARLSRTETKGTLFSCLGELLWYLSRDNDVSFIKYYIPRYEQDSTDGKTIYGGYGPRLFRKNNYIDQVSNVVKTLSEKSSSRRAVIQIFDATDLAVKHIEIPCTCTLQFLIRKDRLHMLTHMRSNDAFLGLPHDIFAFTMLQEIIARILNIELGTYKHSVGSLHIYEENIVKAQQFIDEGFQPSLSMPSMPKTNPWDSINKLLGIEKKIRLENASLDKSDGLNEYWNDLAILLKIFNITKHQNIDQEDEIERLKNMVSSKIYKVYIEKRQQAIIRRTAPVQLSLNNGTSKLKPENE